jgi:predicted dehydrogenase
VRQALDTIRAKEGTEIVGAAAESPYEEAAATLALGAKVFPDWRAMLDCEKPDLAVVSPVFAHTGRVIMECAERGIDVFAEKPLAASEAELSEVEAAVRESGIRFCAMHYLRYDPAFYHGARLVREGAIGDVRMVTAQKSYRYGKRPAFYGDMALYGGTIPWVGSHALDWIIFYSGGEFESVTAFHNREDNLNNGDLEMVAHTLFRMKDGVIADAGIDYLRPQTAVSHGDDRVRVAGTKGVIEVIGNQVHLINSSGDVIINPPPSDRDVFSDFVLELTTGRTALVNDEDTMKLAKAVILARDSADKGKQLFF